MKGVIALVLLTVCATSSKDVRIWFQYTIKNVLKEPHFELTQNIWSLKSEPFIRAMETATDRDSRFRFTAIYISKELGYFIATINNVRGVYGPYWQFLRAPNETITTGVSNYFPRQGEHIIFNFTGLN